jgi:hypothetical protein
LRQVRGAADRPGPAPGEEARLWQVRGAADRPGPAPGEEARVTAQVSMNVEHPAEVPLHRVLAAVRAHAAVACAELVGLAPAAALEGFPEDVPMPGFDPARHLLENALRL